MHNSTKSYKGGYICLICEKRFSSDTGNMKRHMREIHLSSEDDYKCPPCNKYFKNRQNIYYHIRRCHKDWKMINYEIFSVK